MRKFLFQWIFFSVYFRCILSGSAKKSPVSSNRSADSSSSGSLGLYPRHFTLSQMEEKMDYRTIQFYEDGCWIRSIESEEEYLQAYRLRYEIFARLSAGFQPIRPDWRLTGTIRLQHYWDCSRKRIRFWEWSVFLRTNPSCWRPIFRFGCSRIPDPQRDRYRRNFQARDNPSAKNKDSLPVIWTSFSKVSISGPSSTTSGTPISKSRSVFGESFNF